MKTRTITELIREAEILSACMLPEMPDYGASALAKTLLLELADALGEKTLFNNAMGDGS